MEKEPKMGEIGMVFYILACILSFGMIWISKLVIQKAIADAYKE